MRYFTRSALTLGGMCCFVLFALGSQKSAAEKRRDDEIRRANEEAAAEEKAALMARFRKECKVGDAGVVFPIYDDDMRTQCYAEIDKSLKVPGSSDFPMSDDKDKHMTTDDGCNRIFESSYTAKNVLGVTVRSTYECKYDPRTSIIIVRTK